MVRDHVELVLGDAAAVTDRGLRRRRNEDAVELGRRVEGGVETWVAVVCDGVASARRGDEASLAAVGAAVGAALETAAAPATPPSGFPAISSGDAVSSRGHRPIATASDDPPRRPGPPRTPAGGRAGTGLGGELDALATAASAAAATAAADLGRGGGDSPACTYVAAVVRGGDAVVSWIGDSRAYWLAGDGSSRLLSTDDSWAEEIANAGLMSREEAARDRRAHVLTRWLGRDAPSGPAHARRVRLGVPGAPDALQRRAVEPPARPGRAGPPRGPGAGRLRRPGRVPTTGRRAAPRPRGGVRAALGRARRRRPRQHDARDRADRAPRRLRTRPSVAVDGRGPDERTGPIPLDGEGVVDR